MTKSGIWKRKFRNGSTEVVSKEKTLTEQTQIVSEMTEKQEE